MRSSAGVAAAVVRSWTWLYTVGLDETVRAARRDEIDSDLWEHAHAARGARPGRLAGQILARCLLGAGADPSWRATLALRTDRDKEVVPMNERIKQDGWLLAPMAIVAFGVVGVAAHATAGGFESWWSDPARWTPSPLARASSVAFVAALFIGMPLAAMALRRSHPGWTVVLLLPAVVVCAAPLLWGEASWWLLMSVVALATLIGALVNLSRHSIQTDLDSPTPART